ncbi:hypothetical protein ACIQZB_28810 [Streptomyces sp. NPDC097727]|uniref:hypothetical protein n=1 Tax=Streptomyces sp. NPDC097727 TaxID=3366092 RepID=UPI0038084276
MPPAEPPTPASEGTAPAPEPRSGTGSARCGPPSVPTGCAALRPGPPDIGDTDQAGAADDDTEYEPL